MKEWNYESTSVRESNIFDTGTLKALEHFKKKAQIAWRQLCRLDVSLLILNRFHTLL